MYIYTFPWSYPPLSLTQRRQSLCYFCGNPSDGFQSVSVCMCVRLCKAESPNDHFNALRCCQAGMLLMFLRQPRGLSGGLCWKRGTARRTEGGRARVKPGEESPKHVAHGSERKEGRSFFPLTTSPFFQQMKGHLEKKKNGWESDDGWMDRACPPNPDEERDRKRRSW